MCLDGRCELGDESVWKILCISCCTVESLQVIEEDYWV